MTTSNARANRVAFGNKFGKGRTKADAQIKRETKRLQKYHSAKAK